MKITTRRVAAVAVTAALGLSMAACGDDDSADDVTTTEAAEVAEVEEVEEAVEVEEAEEADEPAAPDESTGPDTAAGEIPAGGVEVDITGDLSIWEGLEVGIANLAPVPGAERWSRPLEACLTSAGAIVDFQDVGGDPTVLPAILETWQAAGKSAIFNVGIPMDGQDALIEGFVEAGTPVVLWGAGNPAGSVALDANQEEDGRIIARFVAEQIGGEGDVIIVNANNPALQSREAGILEVFADFPGINPIIVGEALGFTEESAQVSAEAALLANPDAKAVIGGFGSLGVGAARAVEAAGSDAIVVSMNGDPEEYDAIRAGGPFVATVADGHEFGGEAACLIAAELLAGGSAPGTAGEPILATSVLVTAANVPAAGESEPTPRPFYQLP